MSDGRNTIHPVNDSGERVDEPLHANGVQINSDGSLEELVAAAKAILPSYDDPANAPQEAASMIYVTGGGSDPEGLYKHDGSSYAQVGSSGGAFEDTDGDGVAELQKTHASFEGGDARNILGLSFSPTEVVAADSPYTTAGESTLYVDTTNGAVEIVLASADAVDGNTVSVYDVGENAGTNAITISTEGSETINPGGQSSISISLNGGYAELVNRGGNWFSDRHAQRDLINTTDITVTNDPHVKGESNNVREEHGTVSHADPGAASDGSWDSSTVDSQAISYATAFSAAPVVTTSIQSTSVGMPNAKNISTTGHDQVLRNFRTASVSGVVTRWTAVGDD